MIDFPRSTFTWKSHPWASDPHYKYAGGYVGEAGAIHHVRFNLEARCQICDEDGDVVEIFLGAPCRTEYTIVKENLFQIPSSEFRLAFGYTHQIPIAKEPSHVQEEVSAVDHLTAFEQTQITVSSHADFMEVSEADALIQATLANDLLNASTTYHDAERNVSVTVEYPINLINLNVAEKTFQVCTGPLILPDLATWDGDNVQRVFLAHTAFTQFDHVEFILQREVAAAPEERAWLDQPRGRDRLELHDPAQEPPGGFMARPRPTVYNETWAMEARNLVLRVPNI
ncbi:MAG: hypothetical protein AAF702_47330 [Chloroflexota bacterium]